MRFCPGCQQNYEDATIRFCIHDGQPLVENANSASSTQSQPQSGVAEHVYPSVPPFSASLAVAFFAPHFFKNTSRLYYGITRIPCQENAQVSTLDLSRNLLMISFWYLSENNLIRLTPAAKQGIFKNSTTLAIEFNFSNQLSFPGLEFDLLSIIKSSPPGVTVEGVVRQLLPYAASPYELLLGRLTQWFVQLGYGQPDNRRKPRFRMTYDVNFSFVPDCGRIAACSQAAQIIQRDWMKFQAEQPELIKFLYEDVTNGISHGGTKHHFH